MWIRLWCPDATDRVTQFVLGLLALVFGVLALIFFFYPVLLFGPISVSEGPPALWAELRAGYGGLFGTAAIIFGASVRRTEWQESALAVAALILAGFVFGRCLSLVLDGVPENPIAIINLVAEAISCVAVALFWRRRRKMRVVASS